MTTEAQIHDTRHMTRDTCHGHDTRHMTTEPLNICCRLHGAINQQHILKYHRLLQTILQHVKTILIQIFRISIVRYLNRKGNVCVFVANIEQYLKS